MDFWETLSLQAFLEPPRPMLLLGRFIARLLLVRRNGLSSRRVYGLPLKVRAQYDAEAGSRPVLTVVVSPNASFSLLQARSSGNAAYDPTSGITLYYASARNQITVNSHVVPSILATINPILSEVAIKQLAAFLRNANSTAVSAASACPQCLAAPFILKSVDLVPFDSAVASGSTMVGLIFVSYASEERASFSAADVFLRDRSYLHSPSPSSKYCVRMGLRLARSYVCRPPWPFGQSHPCPPI